MNYTSHFIHGFCPYRFGRSQVEYIDFARSQISKAADLIRSKKGGDNKALFHEILEQLSAARGEIARRHGTEDAICFGVRREKKDPLVSWATPMSLYPPYGSTCARIIAFAGKKFQPSTTEVSDPYGKVQLQKIDSSTIERHSSQSLSVEILPSAHFSPTVKDAIATASSEHGLDPACYPATLASLKNWAKADPKAVAEFQLGQGIGSACRIWKSHTGTQPGPSEFWSLTVRMGFNDGKAYALSRYLIPVSQSSPPQFITILHQNLLLIERTLQEISGIFDKILQCETQEKLKDLLAHFSFLFAHCMCVSRGNAAILEWFLHAMCNALGYNLVIDQGSMVDLEAFANPLFSGFQLAFERMIKLTPKR